MLPDFSTLVSSARESVRPYRWLVKQSRCRACGNVHERAPILMREEHNGWSFATVDDLSHDSAPVVFEEVLLAWCEHCHSPAAQELTRNVRLAVDEFANTSALAKILRTALARYDADQCRTQFHHV